MKPLSESYAIQTNALTKSYRGQIRVNDLNLHIPTGKIYGLLGRNGAGKTTIMKLLLRLAAPDSGSIFLFGADAKTAPPKIYRRIGALIETPSFYGNLTAAENLEILLKLRGCHKPGCVKDALQLTGLADTAGKQVKEFSLGMKQRLGIAAAIMHEPELLILDEPVNSLDPIGIHEIRNYLLTLCHEKGTTLLISSHILSEVEQMADIIGILHEGILLEETTLPELHRRNRKYAEFQVSNTKKAALVLEQEFQISDYLAVGHHNLRIFECLGQCAQINESLIRQGISVAGLTIEEETLEDYFSALIGGGEVG